MRIHRSNTGLGIVALAMILAFGTAASAAPISKCNAQKKKCIGKYIAAVMGCHAKAESKSLSVDPQCLSKATVKITGGGKGCFDKADTKNDGCSQSGNAGAQLAVADAFILDVVDDIDPGYPAPHTNKCDAAQKKCAGKKASGLMACSAKENKDGVGDPNCAPKIQGKFSNVDNKGCFDKAVIKNDGPCDGATAIGIETKVDNWVAAAAAALDTAGPTPTPTPTSTGPTPTPGPGCGNGLNDPGEACDASAPSSGWGNCGADFTCLGCNCACPTRYEVAVDAADSASVYDLGWNGLAFRQRLVTNGTITFGLGGCAGGNRPCGICNVTGVVDNATGKLANRRCSSNTAIACTSDAACTPTGGTCQYYLGSWEGLAVGGVTGCVANYYTAATGTVNVETGDASISGSRGMQIGLGLTIDQPCSRCLNDAISNDGVKGGTCNGGPRSGLTCDANGTQPGFPDFGTTSLDCPMTTTLIPSSLIQNSTFPLTSVAGPVTKTVTAANPSCSGSPGEKCLCDTCNDLTAEACEANADCPDPVGPIGPICGGKRCIGGTNDGTACNSSRQCAGGSNDYAACTVASQCPGGACTPFCTVTCTGGPNAGNPCTVDSECPGVFPASNGCPTLLCGRPGEPTRPSTCIDSTTTPGVHDCTDLFPVDGVGSCTEGPLSNSCSIASGHPQISCSLDSDCASCGGGSNAGAGCFTNSQCPGSTCTTTPLSCETVFRACHLTGSAPGFGNAGTGTLIAPGAGDTPIRDVAHPTLGTVACVPPGGASSANAAISLPGPLRMTRKATVTAHP